MKSFLRCAMLAALVAIVPASASAGDLKMTMQGGRVTIIAQDVTIRQILIEWARLGQTTVVNADKVIAPPVTLQIIDRPESEALDILLRSASGYVAAPRAMAAAGASTFDRIFIMPPSRAPAGGNGAPVNINNPTPMAFPRPMMPQPTEDDEAVVTAPMAPPQMPPPQFPGAPNGVNYPYPGMQPMQPGQQPQGPLTSPRPGMLPSPQAPAVPPNPYAPVPVAPPTRPGGPGGPGGPGR